MTVIERLYDNAWYVANAAPPAREQLEADVTRAWMAREEAVADVRRARTVAQLAPGRSALALSSGTVAQAEYDRARARVSMASRCTDIVNGHAFSVKRTLGRRGAMTVEVASCTLGRSAALSVAGRGQAWTAVLTDPRARWGERTEMTMGTDPWAVLHWACDWIVTGQV